MKLAHVDSLLLPLQAMAMEEQTQQTTESRLSKSQMEHRGLHKGTGKSIMSLMTEAARRRPEQVALPKKRQISAAGYASRFVLKEARCNDDEEDSVDEEDEDEDTDLSGFIVDDDADISFHDSSASESEDEDSSRPPRRRGAPRRRLHRGSPTRRRLDFSDKGSDSEVDKENAPTKALSDALQHMHLTREPSDVKRGEVEVVDLTSSPAHVPDEAHLNTRPRVNSPQISRVGPVKENSYTANPFDKPDAVLKLPPPLAKPELTIPPVTMPPPVEEEDTLVKGTSVPPTEPTLRTPPATPSRSAGKLESPSKLLSPSKRQLIPQSPHRPSMDAFWDHNVINEWNDEYSPKKAPATSPRKRGIARFQI